MNKTITYPELKEGELYSGILLGEDGEPDHHVILLPNNAVNLTWDEAMKFASDAGGDLPTRREQSLLFANIPDLRGCYWSNTQHSGASGYAWGQDFGYGDQDSLHQNTKLRARAVRRSVI
ncbi:MAG: hypothetical protein WC710_11310 [Gallionella sp.]|jgi:hypothetical protein